MSETATAPARKRPAEPALPARGVKPSQYLQDSGWTPLGDPDWESCLWLKPGFRMSEKVERVSEPMTGEVERHAAGVQALADGKISHNPEPRLRNQVRVTPRTVPVPTAQAYLQQMEADLRGREKALAAQYGAEQAHVG